MNTALRKNGWLCIAIVVVAAMTLASVATRGDGLHERLVALVARLDARLQARPEATPAAGMPAAGANVNASELARVEAECQELLDAGRAHDAVARWAECMHRVIAFANAADPFDSWQLFQRHYEVRMPWWNDRRLGAAGAALRPLAQQLERLDRTISRGVDVEYWVAEFARSWCGEPDRAWDGSDRLASWRHGFSPLRRYRSYYVAGLEHLQLIVPREPTWQGRARQLSAWNDVCGGGPSGESMLGEVFELEEWSRRAVLGELRMLRMAVALHVGEPLRLQDPISDQPIRVETTTFGHVLRFGPSGFELSRVVER